MSEHKWVMLDSTYLVHFCELCFLKRWWPHGMGGQPHHYFVENEKHGRFATPECIDKKPTENTCSCLLDEYRPSLDHNE